MAETKRKGKAKKFNLEWIVKYGLEVSTRDPSTSEVTTVVCSFCRSFGREDEHAERKRKRTMNAKYFSYPWRSDNFSRHLKQQHPVKWDEYTSMPAEEKQKFFVEKESAAVVNMRSFVQPEGSMKARINAKQKLQFTIDADIIETLIFGLLFDDPEEEGEQVNRLHVAKKNAFKTFVRNDEDNTFVIEVKSVLKLNMVANFVAIGVSFRQASKLYQSVKEETGMGVLGSVSDVEVAQHCRTVCAINLQYLKEIFNDIWAFAIAIDAGNNAGTAYLDLRMRCYYKGSLENLHILAIPMREHHTGEYQYDLIVETMNVLAPDWRHQLIGVTTDGASTMTGCIQGTCTRLSNECHGNIFRVWCGAHQLDLVVKKAFNQLMNKKFLITLTGVTGHLRRQQNLIQDMKSSCPTFATTRWISMGKVLKWFKANRIRLFQHFSEKKPACTPSMEWWLVVIIIQGLVERIEKTFSAMQGTRTLVCEQRQLLTALKQDIKERCYINGPMTDEESISFLAAVNNDPLHGFHLNNYCVLRQEAASSIDEVGRFVQLTMDGLRSSSSDADKEAHDCIISTIANFSLQLVSGILLSRDFVSCLEDQRIRLGHKFSEAEVENIDEQFRKLRLAFKEQSGFSQMLLDAQASCAVQSFEKCWSQLGSEFEQLRMFCGAIASIMPSTSSVESDFSLINWTKDPNSQSLSDFSLESILHCKQYKKLRDLME
ncbi:hypothetical protein IV203_031377 [Nitzschia inconspicua]|uniref:DUF4371 domain-containing protein n=1 Tax=Nitzschia inconspicua TaxID=303405 RepID=A0A9K3P930_9STRA|nr:hypothetical protein IV203_002620 [Nitzschia inconspicua]KAG7368634.1 hypothetical protein IV203_031377 [Nitzschia inconspicua]